MMIIYFFLKIIPQYAVLLPVDGLAKVDRVGTAKTPQNLHALISVAHDVL
jgi:hypothetical protein